MILNLPIQGWFSIYSIYFYFQRFIKFFIYRFLLYISFLRLFLSLLSSLVFVCRVYSGIKHLALRYIDYFGMLILRANLLNYSAVWVSCIIDSLHFPISSTKQLWFIIFFLILMPLIGLFFSPWISTRLNVMLNISRDILGPWHFLYESLLVIGFFFIVVIDSVWQYFV